MSSELLIFISYFVLICVGLPTIAARWISGKEWSRSDKHMTLDEFRARSIDIFGWQRTFDRTRYVDERDPSVLRCRTQINRAVAAIGLVGMIIYFLGVPFMVFR